MVLFWFVGTDRRSRKEGKNTMNTRETPSYTIAKINGDNRRPGMPKDHNWLVRYDPSTSHGMMSCHTCRTAIEALRFAATLNPRKEAKNFSKICASIECEHITDIRLNELIRFESHPGKVFVSYLVDLSHQTDENGDFVSDDWGEHETEIKAVLLSAFSGRVLKIHKKQSAFCVETIDGDTL